MSQGYVVIEGNHISIEDACLAGIRLYQEKRLNDSAAVFLMVLDVDDTYPRALNALAIIENDMGAPEKAMPLLDRLIAMNPGFAKGYNTRGLIHMQALRFEEAEDDLQKAVMLDPGFAEAWGNLGALYLQKGDWGWAAEGFSKAIQLVPVFAEAHAFLAEALRRQGRYSEATQACGEAIKIRSDVAQFHYTLGMIHHDSGDLAAARNALRMALEIDPSFALAECALGNVYWDYGRLQPALDAYCRGAQLSTDNPVFLQGIGNVYMARRLADRAMEYYRQAMELAPGSPELHSTLLMTMQYSELMTSGEIFSESKEWGHRYALAATDISAVSIHSPIRIGYLSHDFRTHSVSYFFEPLLEAHDRRRVTTYCYASLLRPDETTVRLQMLSDEWRECATLSDDALAKMIREDGIDVLVDLAGHTEGNRLGVFARKPAPVQMTWLGYPGTTGLEAIDYRITDIVADPEGDSEHYHTEKLLRLPGCFLCYAPPLDIPDVGQLPALRNGFVTFGSFNNLAKVTPDVLSIWASLLKSVPGSRLILKSKWLVDDATRGNCIASLTAEGVNANNVILLARDADKLAHFARYNEIDIALDTFPYNGTTTTCESLCMGVPVVTLAGDRHASRVGASILAAVGLEDNVAHTRENYIEKCSSLARNVDELSHLRANLRVKVASSSLCNSRLFASRLEDAFESLLSERMRATVSAAN